MRPHEVNATVAIMNILSERSKNLAYEITSIQRCEDEPIAFCGAIQPSGFLFIVDCDNLTIKGISQNWENHFGAQKAKDLIGRSLHDFVHIENHHKHTSQEICELITTENIKLSIPGLPEGMRVAGNCHRSGSMLLIEFEFLTLINESYPVSPIRDLVHQLKHAETIELACQQTASVIKRLSKFDRVMIYRFDENWNGEVIAEAREQNIQPFLHLKYPATDIPVQARELFLQNKSRMIVDVSAEAVPILAKDFKPGEIDLSYAVLRAVSPIHLQYLTNMGVKSSFSAPIRVNDKLWGLIACHHYAGSHHPDRETRSAFELGAQIISGKINDLVARRRLLIKNETLVFTQKFLAEIASGQGAMEAFVASSGELLKLTNSTGVVVKIGGVELMLGKVPKRETINGVAAKLRRFESLSVWSSDCLTKDMGIARDPDAAGALAVPFSLGFEDSLIWFRPEEEQEIRWGGKPKDKEAYSKDSIERLTPRQSFAEWREKIEDHSRPWTEADDECAQYFLFGFVQGIFSKAQALSLAYKELETAAKAKDEFISMVSHELRTPLGIMIGWIDILRDYPQADPEATEAIGIIDRNARLQISLINDLLDVSRIIAGKMRLNPVPNADITLLVSDIVESLRPTATAKSIKLVWNPAAVEHFTFDPDRMRQVIWNLLTNAIKFTKKDGLVEVSLTRETSSYVISVKDNGPGIDPSQLVTIFERFAQAKLSSANLGGLGLGLSIVKSLVELHGGKVVALSEGEGHGSEFRVTLPVYALREEDQAHEQPKIQPRVSDRYKGLKVLIAEDQPESMRALKILMERNGAFAVAVADGKQALSTLFAGQFDVILSDIGMPEMDGHELISKWREEERARGVPVTPAIALTAYASSKERTKALASGFQSHIPKPVDRDELFAVLDSLGLKSKDI